ncbi:TonB-dependent receptor [Bacteroidales bacterium OttesenSCG-928-B11]|nr:TonB-dependent receptor [Bacteroidales bacterium OttesenSCG-928-E04]MDL2309115.1 TonB-dependent receptor [Bacteroidales bacterium OttesenSCG-928-C03]MDL2312423.1 TonB-dependent receptor [Bacteroidales bacterium OttesenSCG-928-B11]MDL2326326.1 TonB-dependent receptor [Bacteroidales bacterium OttesenSCG-928-A14]
MNKKIQLTLALLFPFIVLAQRGSVEGVIMNVTDNKSVGYAGVTLHLPSDSTVVTGDMTDENGKFMITGVSNGTYLLQFQYFGTVQWYDRTITVSNSNNKVNLDTLKFTGSHLLEAAVVTVQRPLFEVKHGTITMNVDQNPTAGGDNVIELLKKMPSVIVDQNDDITIEGKSGVLILVDDKPTYLSGEDLKGFLRSMSANTVERIEVMKKPSARYDAQGTAGVINIITKKEKKLGVNGSVYAGFGYARNPREQAGFNITSRFGKFVFTANYSLYNQKSSNSSASSTTYRRGEDTVRLTTNDLDSEKWGSTSNWTGHNFSFGGDYFINKKNVISILYRGNINQSKSNSDYYTRISTNSIIDSSYSSHNYSKSNSGNHTINLNYKHSFDTTDSKNLHIDLIYSNNKRYSESEAENRYYRHNFQEFYRNEMVSNFSDPSKTNIFTFKTDFEYEVNDDIGIEAGAKISYVQNENFNKAFRNGEQLQEMNNHFVYQENINALYGIFSYVTPFDMDLQVGLRAEQTWTKGSQKATGQSDTNRYLNIFPNISLSYELPKNNQLELSYRYSIYRPGYHSLNPFVNTMDPTNWYTGNPKLRPDYTHSLELDWSWKYKIYVWVGYSYTKDDYEQMSFLNPESSVTISRPENIGKIHSIDIGTSLRFKIGNWWNMQYNLGFDFGQSQYDYVEKRVFKNTYSGWFYFNQSFTILKNYFLELSGYGNPPSEDLFGKTDARITINAGARALFLKKKLSIRLSINDIFNNGFWRENYTYPNGMQTTGEWMWESRSVWLTCSYQFGKQDIKSRNLRGDSDELNRSGGGGNSGGGKGQ